MRRILILGFLIFAFAPFAGAYDVVLKSGAVIHFEKYRVAGDQLIYLAEGGKEESVPLAKINLAATRQRNEKIDPPLALPGLYPTPLGDVARQMNLKPKIDPQGYVFTDDDFPSSPPHPQPASAPASSPAAAPKPASAGAAPNSDEDKIKRFVSRSGSLTEQQFANRILGPDLAEMKFPGRPRWQSRIYAAHQRYLADAKLCISDRVSDMGRRQDLACSRLDTDKADVLSLRDEGKQSAQQWKSRQEKVANP